MKKRIAVLIFLLTVFAVRLFSLTDEPVAVVLAGGGARGAYQIGAWKALDDIGVNVGAIYGVSAGAINGAVMAAGDFEMAVDLWSHIEKDEVMVATEAMKSVLSGEFSFADLLESASELYAQGGLDVSPLNQMLQLHIDEEAVRSSGIEYGFAAYSITEQRQKFFRLDDIPDGELVDYILASANFPLFQRHIIEDEEFIDGGVANNVAVGMIDCSRYRHAVVVSLDFFAPDDIRDLLSDYRDYGIEVTLIEPGSYLGSFLDFSSENASKLMLLGYLDSLRAFGILAGSSYYIYGSNSVEKMFLKLSPYERREALKILEVSGLWCLDFNEGKEIFNNVVIPELLLFGDVIALLELQAMSIGLPQDVLYSEAELIGAIVDNYLKRPSHMIYYNRYLDFISYLTLKAGRVVYTEEEFSGKFISGYEYFKER